MRRVSLVTLLLQAGGRRASLSGRVSPPSGKVQRSAGGAHKPSHGKRPQGRRSAAGAYSMLGAGDSQRLGDGDVGPCQPWCPLPVLCLSAPSGGRVSQASTATSEGAEDVSVQGSRVHRRSILNALSSAEVPGAADAVEVSQPL
jgi:hypothetical protein